MTDPKTCEKESEPDTTHGCNNHTVGAHCTGADGKPLDCGEGGRCGRVVTPVGAYNSWIYTDVCECKAGWAYPLGTEDASSAGCTRDLRSTCQWKADTSTSTCNIKAGSARVGKSGGVVKGQRSRGATCMCEGNGTAVETHAQGVELCGEREAFVMEDCDLCSCSDFPSDVTVTSCNGEEAVANGENIHCISNDGQVARWPALKSSTAPIFRHDWPENYIGEKQANTSSHML